MADTRAPSHRVYIVEEVPDSSDKKPFWQSIGAAWPHGDGKGFNVILTALPIGNKLVIREFSEQEAQPQPPPSNGQRRK
ncbi:hypothetical protein EBZ38_03940 [bacterium]|nr:hypothetical protein [bacterium]NDG02962.1 hypothetical protein [Synechococcaceae bacterium WBB_34_004]